MKRIIMAATAILAAISAHAQFYYQDAKNPDMLRHSMRHGASRQELVLPQVNGYRVYKADLHTHTFLSDGQVTPEFRVNEAWLDGLDIMAVTEHVEFRPYESKMVEYLDGYVKDGAKAKNHRIIRKPADKDGILVDLNYSVSLAKKAAKKFGITIIPGCEVTRDGKTIGHFNALFTTDNNKIYDVDPMQAILNAKAQGALIQHNHPGWSRTATAITEFESKVYAAGLLDGIEIMNGAEFYPDVIDRALQYNLFMSANTDVHRSTANDYRVQGNHRPMTLILSKDKSLDAVREAIEAHRTLAYAFGTLAGEEQLLKDFFSASVSTELIGKRGSKGSKTIMITNSTSIPYLIQIDSQNPIYLDAHSTISVKTKEKDKLSVSVCNMWCGKEKHPVVDLAF